MYKISCKFVILNALQCCVLINTPIHSLQTSGYESEPSAIQGAPHGEHPAVVSGDGNAGEVLTSGPEVDGTPVTDDTDGADLKSKDDDWVSVQRRKKTNSRSDSDVRDMLGYSRYKM